MAKKDHVWKGGAYYNTIHEEPGVLDLIESEFKDMEFPWPAARLTVRREHIKVRAWGQEWRFEKEEILSLSFDRKHRNRVALYVSRKHGVMIEEIYWWPTCWGIFKQAARWRLAVVQGVLEDFGYRLKE
jgi:hypothetical protein